ncbi:MAG: M48 family metalloprotease [Saprospiraceae bacterium]|nr:M48 family metalloprotease [Saprospiraceae bacterium]
MLKRISIEWCLDDQCWIVFLATHNDQFASVLAHELGHFTLNHYNDYRYDSLS